MASKFRTNIMLILLACVSAGVLGYFVWLFLAPPVGVYFPAEAVSTDVETGVVKKQEFRLLQPYASLPIVPTNVGRANPFIPLPVFTGEENGNGNGNGNANAITDLIQNVNGG